MSRWRGGRFWPALALVPLTAASVGWTAALLEGGSPAAEDASIDAALPVPSRAPQNPASYTIPGRISLGVANRFADLVVSTASTNGIPSAALAAYQRAATVINNADEGCHVDWQLIAAIGRVESDHGRYGGNVLTAAGVSRPGIYGIALDGSHNTAEIRDTDAGQYDNDKVYDRAVGPMQFIPSTWSDVGVDADGDGKRNPQDIDDAALASAVYLCSGQSDLATDAGRRQAVYRYNHSREYVELVLSIMNAYLAGDYTSVPNYTTSAITFSPDHNYTAPGGGRRNGGKADAGGKDDDGSDTTPTPEPDPQPTPEADASTDDGDKVPIKAIENTVRNVQDGVKETVDGVLTLAQAIVRCTAEGYNALLTPQAWKACIDDLTS